MRTFILYGTLQTYLSTVPFVSHSPKYFSFFIFSCFQIENATNAASVSISLGSSLVSNLQLLMECCEMLQSEAIATHMEVGLNVKVTSI